MRELSLSFEIPGNLVIVIHLAVLLHLAVQRHQQVQKHLTVLMDLAVRKDQQVKKTARFLQTTLYSAMAPFNTVCLHFIVHLTHKQGKEITNEDRKKDSLEQKYRLSHTEPQVLNQPQ